MDNTYFIFFTIPLSTFGAGFLIGRQLRPLENVPSFSKLFVQHRLIFSFVAGIGMSFLFMVILGFVSGFSWLLFFYFVGVSLLATLSYYFGVTLGWGSSSSELDANNVPTINQAQVEVAFPDNLVVENSFAFIKITINSKKRWILFVLEGFIWIISLVILPLLGFVLISFLQIYLPRSLHFLVWALLVGAIFYLLYRRFMEVLEFIFDKEIIEIDHQGVRVEKYGWYFSSKKKYSSENIKKITGVFSSVRTNTTIRRSSFVSTTLPAFIMWHSRGLKRYRTFGKAIDPADAQRILGVVYAKFPQYNGEEPANTV